MNKTKQKLYIMSGCPGSGKSTFAKNFLMNENTLYVSRDEIRFSMVKEGEEYFSKENQVFNEFVRRINEGLSRGYNVIADATHLTEKSRSKLFFRLYANLSNVEVVAVILDIPYEICIERNEKRSNTRAYVPYRELIKMYKRFNCPDFKECNGLINRIIMVAPDNSTVELLKEE